MPEGFFSAAPAGRPEPGEKRAAGGRFLCVLFLLSGEFMERHLLNHDLEIALKRPLARGFRGGGEGCFTPFQRAGRGRKSRFRGLFGGKKRVFLFVN